MTSRKVDKSLIEHAFAMREQGAPITEILSTTGLSQGTYYTYVHARDDAVEEAYRNQLIAPMLTWPGSKRGELDELLPQVPAFTGKYVEPFLGGGSMFWAIKPTKALLSDANPELISFPRV